MNGQNLPSLKQIAVGFVMTAMFAGGVGAVALSHTANEEHKQTFNQDRYEVTGTYTMFNNDGTAIELKDLVNGTCHIYLKRHSGHFVMYETPCAESEEAASDEVVSAAEPQEDAKNDDAIVTAGKEEVITLASSRPNQSSFTW